MEKLYWKTIFRVGYGTKMNQNSFQTKGWMTILVPALLALYASVKNQYILL